MTDVEIAFTFGALGLWVGVLVANVVWTVVLRGKKLPPSKR